MKTLTVCLPRVPVPPPDRSSAEHQQQRRPSSTVSSDGLSDLSVSPLSSLSPSSGPIAIPTSPSSLARSSYQLHASFDSAQSFRSAGSSFLGASGSDGPLKDLLPNTSVGGSSSGESSFVASSFGLAGPSSATDTLPRRVVSTPLAYSTSPRSPLAFETGANGRFAATPRRQSAQYPSTDYSHTSPHTLHPSPKSRRRRSSVSLSTSTGSAPPFGSFVGSFEQSLLSGRLSALPSLPLPFLASIGVLGPPDAPLRLRCPPHLHLPLDAYFYSGPEGTEGSSPYVGTIDIESHYLAQLHAAASTTPSTPPRFPGYRVPVRGQVQIVVKNPNSTAIKLFLIPYDLAGLERGCDGGKTFVRQKSYSVDQNESVDAKGRLRYALHLTFCSPPRSQKGKEARSDPKYYLHGDVRVVLASRGLDSSEKLKVVMEGPEGVLEADGRSSGAQGGRFAAYGGPSLEWAIARRKVKARAVLESKDTTTKDEAAQQPATEARVPSPPLPRPLPVHDPNGTTFDLALSPLATSSFEDTPPSLSPPSFHAPSPLSLSSLGHVLPRNKVPLPRSSLSLSFARPESPVSHSTKSRSPSLSGLSISRPGSRAAGGESRRSEGSSGSGGGGEEDCGR